MEVKIQMKKQNTSYAVMNQRVESKDSLDDFPTPKWSVRALFEHVIIPHIYSPDQLLKMNAWEPACNRGYMADVLNEYFNKVIQTDIHDYSDVNPKQNGIFDYYAGDMLKLPFTEKVNAVITNPPFKCAEQFVKRGITNNMDLVAVFVRANFLEGIGRWNRLFRFSPPNIFAPFVERVPLVKGRIDPKASTATAYSWLIWYPEPVTNSKVVWIPPCRKSLEKVDDYEIT